MPQYNGKVERKNQTLLNMVRSMMGKVYLPKSFSGYALEITIYILNKVPSKLVEITSYEIWKYKKPHPSHMKVWGSLSYVKRTMSNKLETKSNR